jgi:clan AA aspartic protease
MGRVVGLVHTPLKLSNPRDASLAAIEVRALADTGALLLCIPEHVALQLKFQAIEQREVTTADGKKRLVDYVGPVQIHFANRTCFGGALVLGDEVLLGVVPMEDMDLIVSPTDRSVRVNPQSPNILQTS